jgi:hypothetical protein
MHLTFANFKQVIESQILTRGRSYLRSGQIRDLSFDEEAMIWEAQVEGTVIYEVTVEQAANGDLHCTCDCPYEMGEYCKHIAAILYAIEEAFPELLTTKPRKKPTKRQTAHDRLRQSLEKTPTEKLIALLLEITAQDREVLNLLLARLNADEIRPSDFRRVVKDALHAGRDDYGYIDYSGARRAGRKIQDLLSRARDWVNSDIDRAVVVFQVIIDEVGSMLHRVDDSGAELSSCIADAVESLSESVAHLSESRREALFAYR